jgi:hypothetical protein
LSQRVTPSFLLPQRVVVADDHHGVGLLDEAPQLVSGPCAEHESDPSSAEPLGELVESVYQEPIVTQIRALDERMQSKEDDDGLVEEIADVDGSVERRVVTRTLCALHPVDNDRPLQVRRPCPPNRHAWIGAQRFQRHRHHDSLRD